MSENGLIARNGEVRMKILTIELTGASDAFRTSVIYRSVQNNVS